MPKRKLDADIAAQVLHTGGVSVTGLATIMQKLAGQSSGGHSEVFRQTLRTSNEELLLPMLVNVNLQLAATGEDWVWSYMDPQKLMAFLLEEAIGVQDGLADVFAEALSRCPGSMASPWSLVVGFDEFVPGNKLSSDHSRKAMVLSFSFLELGAGPLSRGVAWVTPIVVRSNIIAQAPQLNPNAARRRGVVATASSNPILPQRRRRSMLGLAKHHNSATLSLDC